jgi:hypothetical protein
MTPHVSTTPHVRTGCWLHPVSAPIFTCQHRRVHLSATRCAPVSTLSFIHTPTMDWPEPPMCQLGPSKLLWVYRSPGLPLTATEAWCTHRRFFHWRTLLENNLLVSCHLLLNRSALAHLPTTSTSVASALWFIPAHAYKIPCLQNPMRLFFTYFPCLHNFMHTCSRACIIPCSHVPMRTFAHASPQWCTHPRCTIRFCWQAPTTR